MDWRGARPTCVRRQPRPVAHRFRRRRCRARRWAIPPPRLPLRSSPQVGRDGPGLAQRPKPPRPAKSGSVGRRRVSTRERLPLAALRHVDQLPQRCLGGVDRDLHGDLDMTIAVHACILVSGECAALSGSAVVKHPRSSRPSGGERGVQLAKRGAQVGHPLAFGLPLGVRSCRWATLPISENREFADVASALMVCNNNVVAEQGATGECCCASALRRLHEASRGPNSSAGRALHS